MKTYRRIVHIRWTTITFAIILVILTVIFYGYHKSCSGLIGTVALITFLISLLAIIPCKIFRWKLEGQLLDSDPLMEKYFYQHVNGKEVPWHMIDEMPVSSKKFFELDMERHRYQADHEDRYDQEKFRSEIFIERIRPLVLE